MKILFTQEKLHTVTEANINFYANPFLHPRRKMKEHDFIYMIEGEWKFGQNKKVYSLKKDHILVLSANQSHYGLSPCKAGTKTMYFHASFESGDLVSTDGADNESYIDTLTDVSQNKKIKKLFTETVNAKISGNSKKANLYMELLLLEMKEMKNLSADSSVAGKIKNIIHQNPETFFSNKELARLVNVSVKTAENKFKAEFGTTIHQYILNFKVHEAANLFSNFPEMSIKEIAANLGFYDEYHFSKSFKKIKGISPSVYRSSVST